MLMYKKTSYVAKVTHPFEMLDDRTAIHQVESCGDISDYPICLNEGEILEYFFTGADGFHFVYYGEGVDGFGFWVNPDLVEIENL